MIDFSGTTLLRKNLDPNFLYDSDEKMHQFDQSIISLDCHVRKNLLFALGVDKKTLYKYSLGSNIGDVQIIKSAISLSSISVDWLNDVIYAVSRQAATTLLHSCDMGKLKTQK